ncbi:response regulator [Streptomyces sp. JJ36]|uniref:response regulator n=1 Tax=Streptomyces sp. JJ36 TaxID=2736645 RepID=UPI0023518BCB|nr:response regulator [Streptomyces sp. JJ36]MCF6521773.1 response regulator [Streptomyces sp. JJ36]
MDEPTVPLRVLVVDDDFMVARLHRTLVERTPGFTVSGEARSGAEALAAVRDRAPDLLLLDIYLPDISGLEVLRELRSGRYADDAGQGVDVLVVTAARDVETVRRAQHGGAVHYIVKPFEGRTLQERLQLYARRRRELTAPAVPGQEAVDQVFGTPPPAAAPRTPDRPGSRAALPKGLTAQTAALVGRTLEGSPQGLSASECAERSGLSRASARRYLEHFAATGRAEVTLRYGTTGRPERRYHAVRPARVAGSPPAAAPPGTA